MHSAIQLGRKAPGKKQLRLALLEKETALQEKAIAVGRLQQAAKANDEKKVEAAKKEVEAAKKEVEAAEKKVEAAKKEVEAAEKKVEAAKKEVAAGPAQAR